MFTGLIEEVGKMLWIRASERGTELQIEAPRLANRVSVGDSVAVNGCCLTVRRNGPDQLTFDLLEETLDRTNLKFCGVTVRSTSSARSQPTAGSAATSFRATSIAPPESSRLNKTARTIGSKSRSHPSSRTTPLTRAHRNQRHQSDNRRNAARSSRRLDHPPHQTAHEHRSGPNAGDSVNVEFDILAKYVERMLSRYVGQDR